MCIPSDPAIPLLDTYPKEIIVGFTKNIHSRFIHHRLQLETIKMDACIAIEQQQWKRINYSYTQQNWIKLTDKMLSKGVGKNQT